MRRPIGSQDRLTRDSARLDRSVQEICWLYAFAGSNPDLDTARWYHNLGCAKTGRWFTARAVVCRIPSSAGREPSKGSADMADLAKGATHRPRPATCGKYPGRLGFWAAGQQSLRFSMRTSIFQGARRVIMAIFIRPWA